MYIETKKMELRRRIKKNGLFKHFFKCNDGAGLEWKDSITDAVGVSDVAFTSTGSGLLSQAGVANIVFPDGSLASPNNHPFMLVFAIKSAPTVSGFTYGDFATQNIIWGPNGFGSGNAVKGAVASVSVGAAIGVSTAGANSCVSDGTTAAFYEDDIKRGADISMAAAGSVNAVPDIISITSLTDISGFGVIVFDDDLPVPSNEFLAAYATFLAAKWNNNEKVTAWL